MIITGQGLPGVAPGTSSPEREPVRILGEPERHSHLPPGKTTFLKTSEVKRPQEANPGPLGEQDLEQQVAC